MMVVRGFTESAYVHPAELAHLLLVKQPRATLVTNFLCYVKRVQYTSLLAGCVLRPRDLGTLIIGQNQR